MTRITLATIAAAVVIYLAAHPATVHNIAHPAHVQH